MAIFVCILFVLLSFNSIFAANDTAEFVFYGDPVAISDAPYMAAVIHPSSFCSGFFVAANKVITAKHCCKSDETKLGFVVYNTVDVNKSKKSSVGIANCHMDPKKDVAVLTLKSSIKNVDLLTIDTEYKCKKGHVLTVYGYGRDERGNLGILKRMETVIKSCDDKGQIATQAKGKTVCNGDSGAPFIATSGHAVAVVAQSSLKFFDRKTCANGGKNFGPKLSDVTELLERYCSKCEEISFWEEILDWIFG